MENIVIDMEAVEKYQIFGNDLIIYSYIKSLSQEQQQDWVVIKFDHVATTFNIGLQTVYRSFARLYKMGAVDKRIVLNNCREYKAL